jgi:hypothetical protein
MDSIQACTAASLPDEKSKITIAQGIYSSLIQVWGEVLQTCYAKMDFFSV